MTHLLLWLLLYPLVTAACVWIYCRHTDADVGRLNQGYAAAYAAGTIILIVLHYL